MSKARERAELQRWAERATRGIRESTTFITLWSDSMASDPKGDPVPVIQLGLAMLLDKPIVIVAPVGAVIPENVRRVARSIKFYVPADPTSIQHATQAALAEAGILPQM